MQKWFSMAVKCFTFVVLCTVVPPASCRSDNPPIVVSSGISGAVASMPVTLVAEASVAVADASVAVVWVAVKCPSRVGQANHLLLYCNAIMNGMIMYITWNYNRWQSTFIIIFHLLIFACQCDSLIFFVKSTNGVMEPISTSLNYWMTITW